MQTYIVKPIKNNLFGRKKMSSDAFWKNCSALTDFAYPWGKESAPPMIFRALHDKKYLYFRFDVIDTEILTKKDSLDKMDVLDSDRVEIFFRSDATMIPYFCFEMDAAGRVLDYKAEFYRKFDYNWRWDGITVRSVYTLNGYRVWGAIALKSMVEYNLIHNNKVEAGLFRGKRISTETGSIGFKWISWIKPESDTPDFHIESAFGELVLV